MWSVDTLLCSTCSPSPKYYVYPYTADFFPVQSISGSLAEYNFTGRIRLRMQKHTASRSRYPSTIARSRHTGLRGVIHTIGNGRFPEPDHVPKGKSQRNGMMKRSVHVRNTIVQQIRGFSPCPCFLGFQSGMKSDMMISPSFNGTATRVGSAWKASRLKYCSEQWRCIPTSDANLVTFYRMSIMSRLYAPVHLRCC